ncbi:helix-turn-helix transcriptional regulator [Azospirillum doebereinerae]|uniref:XRE family transcriptional regulator n=1 Tax=Azospirillum doebereinerae TaxID=92933 RepID=A0A433J8P8_9PROT|nr:helix-turn-helix transcriptional regulator [Azospirillum doebereinerae]RUQ70696.1 XRE family transcriptional regulator [Azospirillum doebereinerae]
MPIKGSLTPGQCRAARGFLDWTQEELADRAAVSRGTIRDFEKGRHALHRSTETLLNAAFVAAGLRFVPACEGGPGVFWPGEAGAVPPRPDAGPDAEGPGREPSGGE